MKKKEKPLYSDWSNFIFIAKLGIKTTKLLLLMLSISTVLLIAINLVQLYIAPMILAEIENQSSMNDLIITAVVMSSMLFIFQGVKNYLEQAMETDYNYFGMVFKNKVDEKFMRCSYSLLNDTKFISKSKNINTRCGYQFWNTVRSLIVSVASFAVYMFLLTDISILMMLLVAILTVIGFFITRKIHEWGYRNREELQDLSNKYWYLDIKSFREGFVQDIKVFGLLPWIQEISEKNSAMLDSYLKRREKNI